MTRRRNRDEKAAWLDLMETDGPFLAVPVIKDTWPAGLETVDKKTVEALRAADDQLTASAGTRDTFVRFVLADLLEWADNLLAGPDLPARLVTSVPEHRATIRPTYALVDDPTDPTSPARALVLVVPASARPSARPAGDQDWSATYTDRLAHALRAQNVPVGLVTNGTEWVIIGAPQSTATSTATFTRHVWREEPDTLRAFVNLLGLARFYGVPDDQTLPALLAESVTRQTEITEALSAQSQAVVEMLVASIGRLDSDHKAAHGHGLLPAGTEPSEVYEACVTILMRMVFLLYAEERGLLPADDDTYARAYAITTLTDRLTDRADQGEDALERSSEGWQRLLATARAIHRGTSHELMPLPAYGGSLFDPDRFPWLEGRATADEPLGGQEPVGVDDRTLLKALQALQTVTIEGISQSVSFRVLDVEQIGYVYEGLLDQDAKVATDWVVGVAADPRGEKNGPELALTELEAQLDKGDAAFAVWLSPQCKIGSTKRSTASILKSLNATPAKQAWAQCLEACGGNADTAKRVLRFHGLLRNDPRGLPVVYPPDSLYLTDSSLRASTGAVYTPRSLAQEVVERTLEPLVHSPGPLDTEERAQWRIRTPDEILDLKVIDIAAGSGAFLASATRYLADQLIEARRVHGQAANVGEDEGQALTDARRSILDHCIYGVDINPMAVEMCKLSLWLITLDKARRFGFLDDRIVSGDSLLGFATSQQLEYVHFDPRRGRALHDPHQTDILGPTVSDVLHRASVVRRQIAAIEMSDAHSAHAKSLLLEEASAITRRLVALGDSMSAASLGGGTDSRFSSAFALWRLDTPRGGPTADLASDVPFALTASDGKRHMPCHFPLVFPEVFDRPRPGFDAVVGNPPFLSGKKISGIYGVSYREHLSRAIAQGRAGSPDLIVFMFLRAVELLGGSGQVGLIATKSLAEGGNRRVGLDWLVGRGLDLRASVKSRQWATDAASLSYCIVWGSNQAREAGVRALCDGELVPAIGSDLLPALSGDSRHKLRRNAGKSFYGTVISGRGFILEPHEAEQLLAADPGSAHVVERYLTGGDLLETPECSAQRYVINFRDWSLERAQDTAPLALDRVRQLVKPDRDKVKRASYRLKWWQFAERCAELYKATQGLQRVLTVPQTGTYLPFLFSESGQVFAQSITAFTLDDAADAGLLNSTIHQAWVDKTSGTLDTRPTYRSTDSFATFVPPDHSLEGLRTVAQNLEALWRAGARHYGGLTEFLNRVNDDRSESELVGRAREALASLDQRVMAAYGWTDLSVEHSFYPTRQGTRWTLPEATRLEVITRLFVLNDATHRDEERPASRRATAGRERRMVETQSNLFEESQ